jgi:dienelactone hydrolase
MIQGLFHAWERKLASVSTNRVVRPFDWGLDWVPPNGHGSDASPQGRLRAWVHEVLADTDRFFASAPTDDYVVRGDTVTFPSAYVTPHPENNLVHARYFGARPRGRAAERAVLVLPQWNADPEGHVGLCRLLAAAGLSALRLSLPYHDSRMPRELERADYILSANLGRTLQVCRQAVMDARRAIEWLQRQGFERIGILGTSLGSCLALLTTAHEPRIRVAALNHVSPFFADVVWHGISTAHVRASLDGHVDLPTLRELWLPISPQAYLERVRHARLLLVYARYDLTFPPALSRQIVDEFRRRRIDHEVAVLPCGHYTTGIAPFKWLDGYVLTRFLARCL